MAEIIKCPSCDNETYEGVPQCPHCGQVFDAAALQNLTVGTETPEPGPPFRVGRVLSRSVAVYGRNFVSFTILALLVYSPLLLLTWLFDDQADPNLLADISTIASSGIAIWLATLFLWLLMQATVVYGTVQDLRGRRVPVGAAVSYGLRRIIPIFFVGLLLLLVMLIGLVLLVIPMFIFMCMFWVSIPVAVIERPGIASSLGRSSNLTAGNRWRVFGIIVLLFILGILASVLFELILVALQLEPVLSGILVIMFQAVIAVFNAVLVAVSYHDLRSAKEGTDAEQLAAVFD